MTLSVVMITKDCAEVVGEALESVKGFWDELLVDDDGSTDGTREIVRKYGGKIIRQIRPILPIRPINKSIERNEKHEGMKKMNLGERKQGLVERAKGDWILVLDADERVSEELRKEISKLGTQYTSYRIPYQNYVFGKPVYYGGERYSKVRLFRNGYGRVLRTPLHEEIEVNGMIGKLKGKIHHHSYRTPWQLFSKFTRYAEIASSQTPRNDMVKKLFLYGPHMFWARFVKEKGYKDGWRGFVLAAAFAYMEALTYVLLFLRKK